MRYLQLIIGGFKGSRVQGFEDSSEILKNYKERVRESRVREEPKILTAPVPPAGATGKNTLSISSIKI